MHKFAMEDETEDLWNDWYEPDSLLSSQMCEKSTQYLRVVDDKREIVRNIF